MLFSCYIGIDYSGASTAGSRLPGLRVFKATHKNEPERVPSHAGAHRNWTREEIAHWCPEQINTDDPVIIGIDHGFSFTIYQWIKASIQKANFWFMNPVFCSDNLCKIKKF